MSLTTITGWIAAVLLFFNFATCLAMPWATKNLKKCDPKNCKDCEMVCLGKFHRPIVILSIIAIIVHVMVSLVS